MIQNKVSIRRAIDMARRSLEIEQMNPIMSDFIEWVWEGEKKIGSTVTFCRKECMVDIVNFKGCLPKDAMYVIGIGKTGQLLEPSTADFQLFSKNLVQGQTRAGMTGGVGVAGYLDQLYGFFNSSPWKFSIHNGFIHLANYEQGQIAIAYRGISTDEEGYPLVNELHTDALAAYLIYMYTQREFLRGRAQKYVHDTVKMRWLELCMEARADDEMPESMDMKVLAGIWNNVLPLAGLNNF